MYIDKCCVMGKDAVPCERTMRVGKDDARVKGRCAWEMTMRVGKDDARGKGCCAREDVLCMGMSQFGWGEMLCMG